MKRAGIGVQGPVRCAGVGVHGLVKRAGLRARGLELFENLSVRAMSGVAAGVVVQGLGFFEKIIGAQCAA